LSELSVFAFGKLPAHGDFVSRGLAAHERDAWDAWASTSLETARRDFGDAFEARHDAAAPWRFAFGPGPLADGWVAGALTPSIDRSGRRFVIVAGAKAAGCLSPDGAGARVAEAVESEIYRTFETGGDIDALVAGAAAALAQVQADEPSDADGRFWTIDPPQEIIARQPPANLVSLALAG
jgi:type VI secretion system protein ImpM